MRNWGRKWKKPFPAKVSGSEKLVHYNGLMDPPGCLLSLHCIGEMLTKAKRAALLISSSALYSVVYKLPLHGVVCRKGKHICSLFSSTSRAALGMWCPCCLENLSLWTSQGLTCRHSKSTSASRNYKLPNKLQEYRVLERPAHIRQCLRLLQHSMYYISTAPFSFLTEGAGWSQ